MKRLFLTTLISLTALTLGIASPVRAQQLTPKRDEPSALTKGQAVEGQLLVKFRSAPTISYESEIAIPIPFTSRRITLREQGLAVRGLPGATAVTKQLRIVSMKTLGDGAVASRTVLAELPEGVSVEDAATRYRNQRGVDAAEPNYLFQSLWTPNDNYMTRSATQDYQWNFYSIRMPEAWDVSPRGGVPAVKVAVIDSGVAFEDNGVYTVASELDHIPFVSPRRFESLQSDCMTPLASPVVDNHPNDLNGHGTHVTGTIAQKTNNWVSEAANGLGAGIAHNVSIIPIKVLTHCASGPSQGLASGALSDVIAGVGYATTVGADVINMSLGGPSDSTLLHTAITTAVNAGIVVVVASGNEATRTSSPPMGFPAEYPEVITVGATRFDGRRAEYSNYGPELDIVAPGGQLWADDTAAVAQCIQNATTWAEAVACVALDQNNDKLPDGIVQQTIVPGDPTQFTGIPTSPNLISQFRCIEVDTQQNSAWLSETCGNHNGTSMAAPHVSAAAALMLSVNSSLTPAQVKDILTSTASKTAIPGYTQAEHGAGLLDVMAALLAASGGTITPPASTPTPTPTPGGPTATPPPSQGINWNTKTLSFHADSLVIVANGQTFTAPVTGVTVHSDPGGPTYTTLEATWFDAGTEMRLNMYFKADANKWWVTEARTYGGADPGKWVYYTGGETLAPFTATLGSTLTIPNVVLISNTSNSANDMGTVTMTNVSLKTKLGTTSENFQLLVGDVNDTNTITIEDVSAVLSKYTDFKITVSDGTPEDVNADGFVTIEDVALILLNYNDFSIPGETP